LLKSNQEKILSYYQNHNSSQLTLDNICASGGKPNRKHLILLSAKNKNFLKIYVKNLLNYLESKLDNEKLIPDIEYFLIFEREIMEERLALVVDGLNDLVCKLNDFNSGKKEIGGLFNNGNGMSHNQINLFMSDSDAKELLFKWINRGDVDKVAHLWLHGIPIDWNTIFGKHTYSVMIDKEFPVPHSELSGSSQCKEM
jgi:polyketide synthase PksJ